MRTPSDRHARTLDVQDTQPAQAAQAARPRRAVLALLVALVLALPAALLAAPEAALRAGPAAQEPPPTTALDFELLDHLGGAVTGIAGAGERAYISRGFRLEVLDLADPRQPQILGRSDRMSGLHAVEAASGALVYLVERVRDRDRPETALDRLHVYDASDATRPLPRGRLELPAGALDRFVVAGDVLYAAAGDAGIRLLDLRDPDRPQEAGYVATEGSVLDIATDGARLATSGTGLALTGRLALWTLADDPLAPRRIGALELAEEAETVGLAGDIALVATGTEVLLVDVSRPGDPRVRSRATVSSRPGARFAFAEDRAYLRTSHQPVRALATIGALDISDPDALRELHDTTTRSSLGMITVRDALLAADDFVGVRIYEPEGPDGDIHELPRLPTIGHPTGIDRRGDLAYVADWDAELWILDLSEPARPQVLGRAEMQFATEEASSGYYADFQSGAVTVRGDLAYVARQPYFWLDGGLHVVDVSDPTAPFQRSAWDPRLEEALEGEIMYPGANGYRPVLLGDRLWLGGRPQLTQLDVSNPDQPTYRSYFSEGFAGRLPAGGLRIAEDELWLADPIVGLQRFSLDDPSRVQLLETIRTAGGPEDLAFAGEHLLVADGDAGIRVLDRASREARLQLPGLYAARIQVEGDTAFVSGYVREGPSSGHDEIWALDVGDGHQPRLRGQLALDQRDFLGLPHMARVGDQLYVTHGDAGLAIYTLTEGAPLPAPTAGPSLTPLPTSEPTATGGPGGSATPTVMRPPGPTSTPAHAPLEHLYLPTLLR